MYEISYKKYEDITYNNVIIMLDKFDINLFWI